MGRYLYCRLFFLFFFTGTLFPLQWVMAGESSSWISALYEAEDSNGNVESLRYRLSPSLSIRETHLSSLVLDYRKENVVRIDHGQKSCQVFPFSLEHLSPVQKKIAEDMAKSQIKFGGDSIINGYSVRQCDILYGASIMLQRRVVGRSLLCYGQEVHPRMIQGWSIRPQPDSLLIQNLVDARKKDFQKFPFIKRLDILGFAALCSGFPAQAKIMESGDYSMITLKKFSVKTSSLSYPLPDGYRCIQ